MEEAGSWVVDGEAVRSMVPEQAGEELVMRPGGEVS